MSKKKTRMAARFAAAAIIALFAWQGSAFGLSKKDLAINLKEKRIRDLSSSGLTLAFHVGIRNSSASACFLARTNYRVTINQKEYLRLSEVLEEPIRIGAGEEVIIALPLKVTYALLFEAIGPVEEKAACDIVGDLVFTDEKGKQEKVAFAFSGEFPIFEDPVVEFQRLRINDLTVGGGDVVFDVKFGNPNNYDLIGDTLTYDLRFGEATVLKGEIPGDKNMPARGDKTFSLPFLMDFFEVGKEVYDLLQIPPVPCRFSGQIAVNSVWGPLSITFDKAGPLEVVKNPE